MKNTEEIFKLLKVKFGEAVLEIKSDQPVEVFIIIAPNYIDEICRFLRDEDKLNFDNCMNLSGVDDANGESVTNEEGLQIIGGTLSVYYHLESTSLKHKITIKTSTQRENPLVKSVAEIWRSTDWHERESYDLLGIVFENHPDLRRILMPYDWEAGHPLRKDYKNPEFYQGMKVPY